MTQNNGVYKNCWLTIQEKTTLIKKIIEEKEEEQIVKSEEGNSINSPI